MYPELIIASLVLLATASLTYTAPLYVRPNELAVFHTTFPSLRSLYKRDSSSIAETSIKENRNGFADENYDMELAEVNVFRPVFRYRASYARRGG